MTLSNVSLKLRRYQKNFCTIFAAMTLFPVMFINMFVLGIYPLFTNFTKMVFINVPDKFFSWKTFQTNFTRIFTVFLIHMFFQFFPVFKRLIASFTVPLMDFRNGWRTFQPQFFSTLSFVPVLFNLRFFNHKLFNHKLVNHEFLTMNF